jgi:hypothetical protein
LVKFVTEIFKLEFSQEPSYTKLKHLLVKALLESNECPDSFFSWSQRFEMAGSSKMHQELSDESLEDESFDEPTLVSQEAKDKPDQYFKDRTLKVKNRSAMFKRTTL